MKKRKYILVLSGGGAKGAFQVGTLKYIFKHGFYHDGEHIPGDKVKFDYIAGISAGSLNAAMVAMGKFKELEKLWTQEIAGHPETIWTSEFIDGNLKPKDGLFKKLLPDLNLWKGLGLLLSKKKQKQLGKDVLDKILEIESFASNDPLKQRLDEIADLSLVKDTLLRVGYVSLDSGEYHTVKHSDFDNNEQFKKAILASTAMPVIWKPVEAVQYRDKDGQLATHRNLVDGGIRNVSPLGDIVDDINRDYDPNTDYFVVIINNHNNTLKPLDKPKQNFLNIAYRALVDITLNEIFINDIREFTRINRLVHQVELAKEQQEIPSSFEVINPKDNLAFRKFYYKIVQPEQFIGSTLDFSKAEIDARIAHGEEVAAKIFGPSPPNSPPPNGSITATQTSGTQLGIVGNFQNEISTVEIAPTAPAWKV